MKMDDPPLCANARFISPGFASGDPDSQGEIKLSSQSGVVYHRSIQAKSGKKLQ